MTENPNENLAPSDRDEIGDLRMSTGFESDESLSSVHTLVKPSLHLTNGNAKSADQHGNGGICDVMGHSSQTNDHRVVCDIDHFDVNPTNIESISGQMLQAFFATCKASD